MSNNDNLSGLPNDTPRVASGNFGHAAQLLGGITIQQQEELADLAYRTYPKLSLAKIMNKHFGFSSLRQVKSTQFKTLEALIVKERNRIEPLYEQAHQIANHPMWKQKHEKNRDLLIKELTRLLGAHDENYMGAEAIKRIAKEALAHHHGNPLTFKLVEFIGGKTTETIFESQSVLQNHIQAKLKDAKTVLPLLYDLEDQAEMAEFQENLEDLERWEDFDFSQIDCSSQREFCLYTEDEEINSQYWFRLSASFLNQSL